MKTIFLDPVKWDLVVDRNGNIAVAADPYAQAQDAASAIRTFQGEVYYDTTQGVPYWQQILGRFPPLALMKARFVAAALTVPGILKARCFVSSLSGRQLRGQVQVENGAGVRSFVGF